MTTKQPLRPAAPMIILTSIALVAAMLSAPTVARAVPFWTPNPATVMNVVVSNDTVGGNSALSVQLTGVADLCLDDTVGAQTVAYAASGSTAFQQLAAIALAAYLSGRPVKLRTEYSAALGTCRILRISLE